MAFCGSCGAQLEGDSRFCVNCGADQTAHAGGAPAAVAAVPAANAPHPVPPVAGMAPQFVPPPGPIPMMMPPTPAKSHGWIWGLVIVGAILWGLWYIGTHNQQNPGQTPAPQAQPGTPGPQAQQPGQPQQPQQQSGYQQPGGQGGGNPALVQAQQFAGRWDGVNGYVQVSQAQWRNGSNVIMQSATLGCAQYAASGQVITQMQTTLNGPAQPGQTISFGPFQMGQMAQGLANVKCGIVGVNPAN